MQESRPSPHGVRFGVFEADLRASELRKHGLKVKLHGRPFQVLALLLERPGEAVMREELRQKLWPADTFVDFDHGLNNAVNKLREALGDSADNPRFVETLPRHGYRFIAPVEKLDGTARQASSGPASTQEALPQVSPSRWPALRRRLWLAVGAATAVAAAVGVWLAQHPALPFEERDWVLIANFDNRTGESLFDGTLEYALERELSNSRFVNVVPRERINDALRLMRNPLDTTIDSAVAREVALRDGGIRALLTGGVEKLDSTYVLSVALMNPSEGITVASFSEDAQGQQNVVLAVRRLSNRLRETLGEKLALIRENEQKLEKVTTPSLRALQLYSQAVALVNPILTKPKWGTAAELLQQAVAADPDFASARIWLAHCIQNIGKKNEAAPHYQRAFELADTTTDRERYFILGSYYWRYLEDNDKAAQAFEVLVQFYPDHFWGTHKLAEIYRQQGRFEELAPYTARVADFRPNHFRSNFWAAYNLTYSANNQAEAEPYFQRARKLASPENDKLYPAPSAWLRLLPAYQYWLRGEVDRALAEVTQVAQTLPSRSGREKYTFSSRVTATYMALGQVKAAEEIFQSYAEPWRSRALAQVAWARGDQQTFREHLKTRGTSQPRYLSAIFLAQAGLLSEAQDVISNADTAARGSSPVRSVPPPLRESWGKTARGNLALARGQTEEAIQLLESAVEALRPWPDTSYFFLGSESLARAWEQQGNSHRALQVLEEAAQVTIRMYSTRAGMWPAVAWTENEFRRAQLYRKVGREKEARKVEAKLLKLLTYADPDHAILRQLKQQREVARTQSPK